MSISQVCALWAAQTVNIPTTAGQYINWKDATISNASVENSGANIGSTGANTVATFNISNTTQQDYVLTFKTAASGLTGELNVILTDNTSSQNVLSRVAVIENTGSWYLEDNNKPTSHSFYIEQLPAGSYTLTFSTKSTTGSYAGNWGKLAFYSTNDYNNAPGTIGIASGIYDGPKLENGNTNVGYVSNGGKATYSFVTATEEADGTWTMTNPTNYADTDIPVDGELTKGMKTLTMQFATTASFLCNYKDITMTRIADHYSKVGGVSIAGQTVTTGATSDWYCQLPVSYAATTTFGVDALYGTVAVTAKDGSDNDVAVTDNGNGTYSIATPGLGLTTTVTMVLTPNSGTISNKTTYTFKIFRIGEISLTAVTVDGAAIDVLGDINNNPYSATYSACYTAAPVVTATQIDEAAATVDAPSISGSTYTYTIHGSMAGGTIIRDYTLILNNVHVYAPAGDDETVNIKANEGTIESNTWSNGVYTLATTSLDSYNQFFKMNGDSYTISVPSDVVVKQVIMKDCSNNYAGHDARLTAVTSTGATAYVPVDNKYYHESEGAKHDIIVNLEGHTAGTDIVLTQQKLGQPMAWIQLTVEKKNPGTAPVNTVENVTMVNNHAVVAVTFDREIANDVTATINGGSVTAEGGSATLYFPVWNLNYSTNYTLNIAKGAVTDKYNNTNTSAIDIAVNTSVKPVVEQKAYDYVVSTADELKAAISAIDAINTNSSAARKVIFLKNGTYDLGSTGTSTVQWVNAHNISFIGESKDGVIICGTSRDISNPVLNIRYGSGQYMQDLTVRNLTDFDKAKREAVSVAVYGGNHAIFKNVAMQAQQDTQVTGESGYYINCDIYGAVDFICGGGDHFYDRCNLIITNSAYITAPSTSPSTKWGYVFSGCTIDKYVGSYTYEADGNFSLGRAWQNEPRCAFLNTKMNVQPQSSGWSNWGELPTHFYEYGSVDSNGDAINLSNRTAPTNSTNLPYNSVLTAEQAAKFTLQNVLGGTDSWLPTDYTYETAAPVVSASGNTISWEAVDDARCYVIFKDGKYLANQTGTSYDITSSGVYTVRAANVMGGLGKTSNAVGTVSGTITPAGWSTFSSSYPLDLSTIDGGTAYYASAAGGETVTLTPTGDVSVPAGEGIMVKGTADDVFTIKVAASGTAIVGNLLKGQTTTGNVTASTDGVKHYVFGYVTETPSTYGFYNLSSDTEVASGKAYLETTTQVYARSLRIVFDDATGIDQIDNGQLIMDNSLPVKRIVNGKLVIEKNGQKFNAAGALIY